MCVIIQVGAKKTLPKQILQNCYNHNRHGWGIMWAKDGKLHTVKEYTDFEAFWKIWHEVPRDAERGIHFRIRTSGETNQANCHPFQPNEDVALMHNGVIDTLHVQSNMSDTFNFCEYELKPLLSAWPDFMEDDDFKDLMEKVTGSSKLLFLDKHGKMLVTRPNVWTEKHGCLFSNSHSLTEVYNYSANSRNNNTRWDGHGDDHYNDFGSDRLLPARSSSVASGAILSNQNRPANNYQELNENNVKSDLYSGSKTDAEGQASIDEQEADRKADLVSTNGRSLSIEDEAKKVNEEIRKALSPSAQDDLPASDNLNASEADEDEGDDGQDDTGIELDLAYLMALPENDLLDLIMDYPRSVACTLRGLVSAAQEAGIVTLDKAATDVTNTKKAVNT